jgi:hypothetical protein
MIISLKSEEDEKEVRSCVPVIIHLINYSPIKFRFLNVGLISVKALIYMQTIIKSEFLEQVCLEFKPKLPEHVQNKNKALYCIKHPHSCREMG